MSFVLPNFNLACNIGQPDSAGVPGVPSLAGWQRLYYYPCALVHPRRSSFLTYDLVVQPLISALPMSLLVPALTDIRGPQDSTSPDVVECPAGSGRFYWCYAVDDVGKGYPNEHRSALLVALPGTWSPPYA
jgi:hypothetical protein